MLQDVIEQLSAERDEAAASTEQIACEARELYSEQQEQIEQLLREVSSPSLLLLQTLFI